MSKVKHGVNSTVLVLIVAGILIAVNAIGSRVFTRLDLTEGKEFTISDATKGILHRLDDVLVADKPGAQTELGDFHPIRKRIRFFQNHGSHLYISPIAA